MTINVDLRAVGTDIAVEQTGIPNAIPVGACYLRWQESLRKLTKLVEPNRRLGGRGPRVSPEDDTVWGSGRGGPLRSSPDRLSRFPCRRVRRCSTVASHCQLPMTNPWSILFILFFARMTMAFQFQSVGALAPLVGAEYGASLADIGLLIGLYFAPGLVFAVPGGAIGARFGDRRTALAAMGLMVLGGGLTGLGAGWETAVAGRVVAGIGGVVINVLATKMVVDWFARANLATAMGIFITSWPVGIATALLLLPPIAGAGGLAAGWLAVPGLAACGLVLLALGYRAPAATGDAAAPAAGDGRLRTGPLVLAGTVWAVYNAAAAMVFSFGPALLAQRGWGLGGASATTSLMLWLMAAVVPVGGLVADRTGRPYAVIVAGLAAFAACMVAALHVPSWAVPAVFVALGLAGGFPAGPLMSLPSQVLEPATRGLGMGIFFAIYYAAFLVAPGVAGRIADRAGDAGATFLFGAALIAVAIVCVGLFRRAAAPRLAPAQT